MRRVVRVAGWLSLAIVVAAFLWAGSLLADFHEWTTDPDDSSSFLLTLTLAGYIAGPVLAFIWLCVFIVFVIRKGFRTLR